MYTANFFSTANLLFAECVGKSHHEGWKGKHQVSVPALGITVTPRAQNKNACAKSVRIISSLEFFFSDFIVW